MLLDIQGIADSIVSDWLSTLSRSAEGKPVENPQNASSSTPESGSVKGSSTSNKTNTSGSSNAISEILASSGAKRHSPSIVPDYIKRQNRWAKTRPCFSPAAETQPSNSPKVSNRIASNATSPLSQGATCTPPPSAEHTQLTTPSTSAHGNTSVGDNECTRSFPVDPSRIDGHVLCGGMPSDDVVESRPGGGVRFGKDIEEILFFDLNDPVNRLHQAGTKTTKICPRTV